MTKEKPTEHLSKPVEFWQLLIGLLTAEAAVIVFVFMTFPTKEGIANEMNLRSKARDVESAARNQELTDMRVDIKDIKNDIKVILARMPRD